MQVEISPKDSAPSVSDNQMKGKQLMAVNLRLLLSFQFNFNLCSVNIHKKFMGYPWDKLDKMHIKSSANDVEESVKP